MLYKCGQSCILTNGFVSNFFKLSRSMRQGCPIASYLYILQAEPMAESIRNNNKIKGLKVPSLEPETKFEAKISMFADDTQLFHSSESSIIEGFKVLETYCKASGAKLNLHKTKGLYIGGWKEKQPKYKRIKWVKNVVALGTVFGYNIDYEQIWMKKFFKFKEKITRWKNRDLTLIGKKLLINSYIMSSMSYLIDVYTSNIPHKFLQETNELLRDFLWEGKVWRIAKKTMALRKEHGGLELKDLENFVTCKKIQWIIRIQYSLVSIWNSYGKLCLSSCDTRFDIQHFLCQCSNIKGLKVELPSFYKTCLESWCTIVNKRKPCTIDYILNQNLFGNCNITYGQQQSIFFGSWTKSNFIKIKDIWNSVTVNWKTSQEILTQLKDKRNWIGEYNKIKSCIPVHWKKILRKVVEDEAESKDMKLEDTNVVEFKPTEILVDKKTCNYKNIEQKQLYFTCLYPMTMPTCVTTWEAIFQKKFNLEDLFGNFIFHIVHNRKVSNFHWKCVHRAVYSEKRLQRMKRSNGKCTICKNEDETICHFCLNAKMLNQFGTKFVL